MAEDLTTLDSAEIEGRMAAVRERMKPVQLELDQLRAERDVLATELRRRERLASPNTRRDPKQAMRGGSFPTISEPVASRAEGALEDHASNPNTGGEGRPR